MSESAGNDTAPPPGYDPIFIEFILELQRKYSAIETSFFVSYAVFLAFSATLLAFLYKNRSAALRGNQDAARRIVLPAYEPVLWIFMFASALWMLYTGLVKWLAAFDELFDVFQVEVMLVGRVFLETLPVVLLLQKSLSPAAIRRSVCICLVIVALHVIPALIISETDSGGDKPVIYTFDFVTRGTLCLFFGYLIARPPRRASARTIREYSVFVLVYTILQLVYQILFLRDNFDDAFNIVLVTAVQWAFCPFVVWRLLRADTEFWRGIGKRGTELQQRLRHKKFSERVSANGLHVMIEMHRKYIIDFAFLKLKDNIGEGATASVFSGVLNNRTPCAVKVYTPSEVTEEEVASFSNETALCGALQHPNIVKFFGLCVCPPNICLVSELCLGSLDDILLRTSLNAPPERLVKNISLSYMLDAARAVAYLHSFTPAFIHRDIKTGNFLVDENGVVKLTDFGESRGLPDASQLAAEEREREREKESLRDREAAAAATMPHTPKADHAGDMEAGGSSPFLNLTADGRPTAAALQNLQLVQTQTAPNKKKANLYKMSVCGTVDFMAPEIIQGRGGKAEYGESADIYSLSVTLWDILHPGQEKYPSGGSHWKVFNWVLEGRRPPFTARVPAPLRAIIEQGWSADPADRPSAAEVVAVLEEAQAELHGAVATRLADELAITAHTHKGKTFPNTFVAQDALDYMAESGFIRHESEGIRLGNALMDAGIIHHAEHDFPFENSDKLYMFEALCHPASVEGSVTGSVSGRMFGGADDAASDSLRSAGMTGTGGGGGGGGGGSSSAASEMRAHALDDTMSVASSVTTVTRNGGAGCHCRKLAQGLKKPRISSRRSIKSKRRIDEHMRASLLKAEEAQYVPGFDKAVEEEVRSADLV